MPRPGPARPLPRSFFFFLSVDGDRFVWVWLFSWCGRADGEVRYVKQSVMFSCLWVLEQLILRAGDRLSSLQTSTSARCSMHDNVCLPLRNDNEPRKEYRKTSSDNKRKYSVE